MDCLSLVIPAAIGVLAGLFFLGHNWRAWHSRRSNPQLDRQPGALGLE
jgi:DMSO reductase anchor subunit